MIHLRNITPDQFLDLQMVTLQEMKDLGEFSCTAHEIARAVGVGEQLTVAYCMARESLPSLASVCLFSRRLSLSEKDQEEELIIRELRLNHGNFLSVTMQDEGTVQESVDWALRTLPQTPEVKS